MDRFSALLISSAWPDPAERGGGLCPKKTEGSIHGVRGVQSSEPPRSSLLPWPNRCSPRFNRCSSWLWERRKSQGGPILWTWVKFRLSGRTLNAPAGITPQFRTTSQIVETSPTATDDAFRWCARRAWRSDDFPPGDTAILGISRVNPNKSICYSVALATNSDLVAIEFCFHCNFRRVSGSGKGSWGNQLFDKIICEG